MYCVHQGYANRAGVESMLIYHNKQSCKEHDRTAQTSGVGRDPSTKYKNALNYSEVASVSCRLKSLATRLFVPNVIRANNKEIS